MWIALIAAGLVVWALKNLGYLVPPRFVEGALMTRVAGLVTVALLASLVVSQMLQTGMGVGLDARVPAVGSCSDSALFPSTVSRCLAGSRRSGGRLTLLRPHGLTRNHPHRVARIDRGHQSLQLEFPSARFSSSATATGRHREFPADGRIRAGRFSPATLLP